MLFILNNVLILHAQIIFEFTTMKTNLSKKMVTTKEGVQTLLFSNSKAVNWNVKRRYR